jgi:hypothetical protein
MVWRLSREAFAPILPQLEEFIAGFPWDLVSPPGPARPAQEIADRLSQDAVLAAIGTHRDLHHALEKYDVTLPAARVTDVSEAVRERLRALGVTRKAVLSGAMAYPPGGWMGWHTNSNRAGWRLYVNYVECGGRSFFRWWDGVRVHTDVDTAGFNFRVFRVLEPPDGFWHCVFAGEWRLSVGHRFHEADPHAIASAAGARPR